MHAYYFMHTKKYHTAHSIYVYCSVHCTPCILKNCIMCTVFILHFVVQYMFAEHFSKCKHISLCILKLCILCTLYIFCAAIYKLFAAHQSILTEILQNMHSVYVILLFNPCSLIILANACMLVYAY